MVPVKFFLYEYNKKILLKNERASFQVSDCL